MADIENFPTPYTPADFEVTPLSGINSIDGILWGRNLQSETYGQGTALSYSFPNSGSIFSTMSYAIGIAEPWQGLNSISSSESNLFKETLLDISAIADINFYNTPEDSSTVGTIRVAWTDFVRPANTAWAYLPAASASAGDIWLNSSNLNPSRSDLFFKSLLIHEVGHALGLKHPDENGDTGIYLTPNNDSVEYTIMSYNPSVEASEATATSLWPQSLMALDILALQYLYGPNLKSSANNDAYHYDTSDKIYETIWDVAGQDTLSFSGSANLRLNLNPGEWSHVGTTVYYWDKNGNRLATEKQETLYLTQDTYIENVIADSGHDRIEGNNANNNLIAGAGHDTVKGNYGADHITGENGNDILTGNSGTDSLSGGQGHDQLFAGPDDNAGDFISGGAGDDTISGGVGDDLLIGGGVSGISPFKDKAISATDKGSDIIYGGTGNDTLIASGWHNIGGDNISFDMGEQVNNNDEENQLWAGAGNDLLIGSAGADQLGGCKGEDTIISGDGDDTVWGGSSADILSGNSGADLFIFEWGHGTDQISDFDIDEDLLDFSDPIFSFNNHELLAVFSKNQVIGGISGLLINTSEESSLFLIGLSLSDIPSLSIVFSSPTT